MNSSSLVRKNEKQAKKHLGSASYPPDKKNPIARMHCSLKNKVTDSQEADVVFSCWRMLKEENSGLVDIGSYSVHHTVCTCHRLSLEMFFKRKARNTVALMHMHTTCEMSQT